jgi:hypothetical protein
MFTLPPTQTFIGSGVTLGKLGVGFTVTVNKAVVSLHPFEFNTTNW